jgi:hypothetical protein
MLPPKLHLIKTLLGSSAELTPHQLDLSAELEHLDTSETFENIVRRYVNDKGIVAPAGGPPKR